MTLSSQQTKVVYEPDGVSTVFAVPFPVFDAADVECVRVSEIGETIHYSGFSVLGVASGNVTVHFAAPPPAGIRLVIRRATRLVQESDYPTAGRFPAKTLERDLDRIVAMVQDVSEHVDRTVKAPADGSQSPEELLTDLLAAREDAKAAAQDANDAAIRAEAAAELLVDKINAVFPVNSHRSGIVRL